MGFDYPSAAEVARSLKKHRKNGDGWMACCPAHEDKNPSLSIDSKNGKLVWHCHAGCAQDEVRDAFIRLGLLPQRQEMPPVERLAPSQDLTLDVTQEHFTLDEISVGKVYAEKHLNSLRYDHTNNKWHHWNNFRWEQDKTNMTLWGQCGPSLA